MNAYIQRMKDTITNYLGEAQTTEKKIKNGYSVYQKEPAEREEKRLREELKKKRQTAEAQILSIYEEAAKPARDWGKLDGNKITADAKLLEGAGVTPEQFSELLDRYADNYTMLDRLRAYGIARNEETRQKNKDPFLSPYNVSGIPAPDSRVKVWDRAKKEAINFLNIADGTGFNDPFTASLARETADKAFEAFGSDIA